MCCRSLVASGWIVANEVIAEVVCVMVRKSQLLHSKAARGGGTRMMEDGSFVKGLNDL